PSDVIVSVLNENNRAIFGCFVPGRKVAVRPGWVEVLGRIFRLEVGTQQRVNGIFKPGASVGFVSNLKSVAESRYDGMILFNDGYVLGGVAEVAVIGVIDAANGGRGVPIASSADDFGILRPVMRPTGRRVMQKDEAFALLH